MYVIGSFIGGAVGCLLLAFATLAFRNPLSMVILAIYSAFAVAWVFAGPRLQIRKELMEDLRDKGDGDVLWRLGIAVVAFCVFGASGGGALRDLADILYFSQYGEGAPIWVRALCFVLIGFIAAVFAAVGTRKRHGAGLAAAISVIVVGCLFRIYPDLVENFLASLVGGTIASALTGAVWMFRPSGRLQKQS
jgi:hypothetical protein